MVALARSTSITLKTSCLLNDSFLESGSLNTALPKQFRSMGLSAQTITEVWEGRTVQRKQAMEQLWKPELTISSDYAFTHRWSRKQKQQALERESNYKHNAGSISGTFPASHSLFLVSCLLVFCPFSCDSTTVYRTLFWTGLGTWYNFLKILPRDVSCVMEMRDCENNWNEHCPWTCGVKKSQPSSKASLLHIVRIYKIAAIRSWESSFLGFEFLKIVLF